MDQLKRKKEESTLKKRNKIGEGRKGEKEERVVRKNNTNRHKKAEKRKIDKVGESKYNRWYKMVKGEEIPEYLKKE